MMNVTDSRSSNGRIWCIVGALLLGISPALSKNPPHIIYFIADDMGWNDVSFHGSDQIQTPNIDALAYDGVVIHNHYTEAICTPTRSALLTGKYPIRSGTQSVPLRHSETRGIPLNQKLLPEYLRELGYTTRAVGKWHVGMASQRQTPTRRGFDEHFGFLGGFVDYYERTSVETWSDGTIKSGYDWYRNITPVYGVEGYLTDVITDEAVSVINLHDTSAPLFLYVAQGAPHAGNDGASLQAPPAAVRAQRHIANSNRRYYAAVVSALDEALGRVVNALSRKKMLQNSIIVFLSDNGAPTVGQYNNWGSNLPFRGIKQMPWEGAVRTPTLVWSANINGSRVWNGPMHVTDWLPTLISAAGGDVPTDLDGHNQWSAINNQEKSARNEVLISMDDIDEYAAYRIGDYKLIIGNMTGLYNDYYGEYFLENASPPPSYTVALKQCQTTGALASIGRSLDLDKVQSLRSAYAVKQLETRRDSVSCVPTHSKYCLFDVSRDPQELYDVSQNAGNSQIAATMLSRLHYFWSQRIPRTAYASDPRSDPGLHNYTWTQWIDDTLPTETTDEGNDVHKILDKILNFPWLKALWAAASGKLV